MKVKNRMFLERKALLGKVIIEYEELCQGGRAQSEEAKSLLGLRKLLFKGLGLEECAHNAAIFGSKRYAKYKFKDVNIAITPLEYKELMEKEANND